MATATEVQNNFGRFLKHAQEGGEVVILKNGVEAARLVSKEKTMSFLSDRLVGVLSGDADEKNANSLRVFQCCETQHITGYISALSIPNIVYSKSGKYRA